MKLVSVPANPVPDGAAMTMLTTPDGVTLRSARWAPPPGRKGTVCIFQGRAEFIEKYFEVVRDLQSRGFAVATFDWRGQGLSDRALGNPRKGYVRSFSQYDIDLETFMKEVVLPDCPPPFFGLAHSTGGAIMLRAAHRGLRWFDRLVLTSPLIAPAHVPAFGFAGPLLRVLRLAGFGGMFAPGANVPLLPAQPFVGNFVTSDPVRYARAVAVVEAEPALALGGPTVAWADGAFRLMREFADPAFPSQIRLPILIIAAGRDKVVSTPAIDDFAIHLRAGSSLVIPGSMHEIMMEQDAYRSQFWAAFDAFVPGTPLY